MSPDTTAIVSGLSLNVNDHAVKHFGDPTVYTTEELFAVYPWRGLRLDGRSVHVPPRIAAMSAPHLSASFTATLRR